MVIMRFLIFSLLGLSIFFSAIPTEAQAQDLQPVLKENAKSIERPSRKKVGAVIDALFASGADGVPAFLLHWRNKEIWLRKEDKTFFVGPDTRGDIEIKNIDTGEIEGIVSSKTLKQVKPNSGVRAVIDAALVRFQLSDPDPAVRASALETLERKATAKQLGPLRASIENEPDAILKARKERLEGLLTISYGQTSEERIAAIQRFSGDVGIDVRAVLNPLLKTYVGVGTKPPEDENFARRIYIGKEIDADSAYDVLVEKGMATAAVDNETRDAALVANATDGQVEGIALSSLDTENARVEAYRALVKAGKVDPYVTDQEKTDLVKRYYFYEAYEESDKALTDAARETLIVINKVVGFNQFMDLVLDALSLASIYFLAAIGLAITFGVMGVINMAHGEFIMMGAYTGYVVQKFITDYTLSIIVALPLAFLVTFGAGVLMERLVIRHLMHRPLETLLATFGISIALQQLAKNIFGTQAVPLTAPGWLDGPLVFNDIISISYIRIAIFVIAVLFFVLLLFVLKRTRLGLEVRAVTQNPSMASSMGINPDRINMLTFGLGSGIAGIAGVAIGLFAQVTSELGSNYIVQSFRSD